MRNSPRFLLLPILLLAAACASIRTATVVGNQAVEIAPAEPSPEPAVAPLDAEIPPDPKIRLGRFDNGLRYYIRVNHRPEQRAELRLFVNAGSVLEDDDQQGLAHFVEHMAFNGTRHFEKHELIDYLESIGTRFGADLNAYTSFDETGYLLKVPADDPEILARGFQILADWAHGVTFEDEEIDKERGVLVEEWRLGRGAQARVFDQQLPVLLYGSRYARRLPIGRREVIEGAPYEALRRFYRDWYRPDLMAVVAVGDFDPDRIEELIRERFHHIPAAEEPPQRPAFEVPTHRETLFSRVTDPELTRTDVAVHYKHPPQPEGSYGDYRRSLVQALYHDMLNQRLGELAREVDPPFLYGSSGMGAFARTVTFYSLQAGVREGGVKRGLEALLREVERVDRHGFTESEIERSKIRIVRDYEQAYRERDKLESASLAAEYGRHFLEQEPIPGIEVELALVERFLPTIELAEVNQLARQWITDENRVIVVSGPEKQDLPLPEEPELLAVFEAVAASEIEPFADRTLDAPLLPEVPAPGEVAEETVIAELGVTEWRLGNGVRVVLKPTDFKNDEVLLGAFSPGGHSLVDDELHTSAIFATAILAESGLGEFDRIELGKALSGKVAGAHPYITELEEGMRGGASPQDLETMFQLIYLSFSAPRLEQRAFDSFISRMKNLMANRDSRPQTVYQDKLTEVMTQGHWRRRPISAELLREVDPEAALQIYRDRFADASDFTFVLVGNFEPAVLRPLVETYLGGLPSTGRRESWRDVGVRPPEGVVEFEVKKGLEPQSQVDLLFSGPVEWSRERAHEIASLAQVLQIRLREVLREDLGGTYGARVAGTLSWRPAGRYQFSIGFGCAPEEVETLVEAVFQEVESIRENGIEQTYVTKIREIQRRQRETDLEENRFWLQGLEGYYSRGLDPRLLLAYDELVESSTSLSLQAAARRYLTPERYVLGVLHPEEGVAEGFAGG